MPFFGPQIEEGGQFSKIYISLTDSWGLSHACSNSSEGEIIPTLPPCDREMAMIFPTK